MILVIRLWWALRPILNQLKELSTMKFSVNVVFQMLALVAQGLMQMQELLPPRGKFWAVVVLSGVQGVVGVLAHFRNPDGTPAEAAWIAGK